MAILFLSRQAICTIASYPARRSRAATATFDMCAVAPRCVGCVDGVARITDDPCVIEDGLRVGAVRGEELSRYREVAGSQDLFESGARPHSAHSTGRLVTFGLMSLIHDEVPSSRRSVGVRTS